MVQYIKKYKKNIAADMRKRGMSYSEIENRINVSKSTLSFWLRDINLSNEQKEKLNQNRLQALKRGSEKRILKTKDMIEKIRDSSARDIKAISKRELWLMGIILYWRERFLSGNENDLRKGVKFTSSDPYLVKFFLKWLKDIGKIKNEEIEFELLINQQDLLTDAVKFWSDVTEFPESNLTKFYHYATLKKPGKSSNKNLNNKTRTSTKNMVNRNSNRTKYGLLRVRVRASSMLARQIYGWIKGIIKFYWE